MGGPRECDVSGLCHQCGVSKDYLFLSYIEIIPASGYNGRCIAKLRRISEAT